LIADEHEKPSSTHEALMDRVYRNQRHIYDLSRKYYLLGRDRLIRELDARPGETAIEIGCGTARNLIAIAAAYPGVGLYGIDASSEMLRTADESVGRAGLASRVLLRQGLAENLSPRLFALDRPFDHAIFSYSLSMIPDWKGALAAAAASTTPNGSIHVVDFGDLNRLWGPANRGLRAWLRLFHVAPRDELLAALEAAKGRKDCSLHILPGRYAFVFKASPAAIRETLAGRKI
jgi:S-adenosylmethionine-diacylgycerolhomoserine-N-methlytransferase